MTATTMTQTYVWRAYGVTEDITECDRCGKIDLKGTVRMVAQYADGDQDGEMYMGTDCAARMTGRKAAEIRHEANEATKARRAAHAAWTHAQSDLACTLRDQYLAAQGLSVRQSRIPFETIVAALRAADASPEMLIWKLTHPEPPMS